MKTFIVFSCLVALTMSSLESEEERLEDIHKKCQSNPKTHADEALLDDVANHLHDPQVLAHVLCESEELGLQDHNGKLNPEVIKCKIRLSTKKEKEVAWLTKKCAIQEKTPEKTAVHLFTCLDEYGVTFFHDFLNHKHKGGHGHNCQNKG